MRHITAGLTNLVAVMVILVSLAACQDEAAAPERAASQAALSLAGRAQLYGGDPQAWLTGYGDNADSARCKAKLKLPLAAEPAWVTTYSDAEFSPKPPQTILHYNGVLCVSSVSPQLLLLDVASGAKLYNERVHASAVGEVQNASMRTPFFHPAGFLVARDETAAAYCFDVQNKQLQLGWINTANVAPDDVIHVTQGETVVLGGDGRTYGVSITDGKERWSYPTLLPRQGKVLSRDGVLVWFSQFGKTLALSADSGELLWELNQDVRTSRVVIDDRLGCIYISRFDESLECRELHTGKLRWTYSWLGLLSAQERAALFARTAEVFPNGLAELRLVANIICCTRTGVALALVSGDVIALDEQGNPLWQARLKQPVTGAVAFDNGLLIVQEYSKSGARMQLGEYLPYMLDPPDWPGYRSATQERQQSGLFNRVAVLSLGDGKVLSAFEPPEGVSSGLIPAYNMVLFGLEGPGDTEPSIQAYPWIDWEGPS